MIRIALLTDKKEPGAAKFSIYYQKHGNPHYGNKKQLVTKSTAEKIQARLLGKTPGEDAQGDEEIADEKSADVRKVSSQVDADEESDDARARLSEGEDDNELLEEAEEEQQQDEERVDSLARKSGLRMKMRADEDEERSRARSRSVEASVKKSIWERLDVRGNHKSSVFDRLGHRSRGIDRKRNQNAYDVSDSRSRRRIRGIFSPYSRN